MKDIDIHSDQALESAPVCQIVTAENLNMWRIPSDQAGKLPHYCYPLNDPKWLTVAESMHMRPDDPVLALVVDDQSYVLPWWIMKNHHVANLNLQGRPFLVNLCEVCSGSAAFFPVVDGKRLNFRIEGSCNGVIVITDLETRSLWSPFMGKAIDGQLKGTQLERWPVFQSTWSEWTGLYPNSLVPDGVGESREGHGAGESPGSPRVAPFIKRTLTSMDTRLPHNELVLGVSYQEIDRAYPLNELHRTGPVLYDSIAGQPIMIFSRPDSWVAMAFKREMGGSLSEFEASTDGLFTDRETRSLWDITGKAVSGSLAGRQLGFVNCNIEEWYAWASSHSNSAIYSNGSPVDAIPPEARAQSQNADGYLHRNSFEAAKSPEVARALAHLRQTMQSAWSLPKRLWREIFTVASLGSGCTHCQAHGAYDLARSQVPTERILALWDFEHSQLFSEAERAVFRFALASTQTPNAVTPSHHAELRKHYSDRQITDIVGLLCLAAWRNRWDDSLATVTDRESVEWATANLAGVGWELGRHAGKESEQRPKRNGPHLTNEIGQTRQQQVGQRKTGHA